MAKLLSGYNACIRYVLILLISVICFIVFWQVFSRFVLHNPSRWSEEVARYLMIWITFIGASVGISEGSHLGLTLVLNSVRNKTVKQLLEFFAYACIILFSSVLVFYGWQYMVEGSRQRGMSIRIPMSVVYAVIPLSGVMMIVNTIILIVKKTSGGSDTDGSLNRLQEN